MTKGTRKSGIEQQEDIYRFISENSGDIVCFHDPNHRYVYVSPACKEILGYDPQELVGTNPWELIHPQDLKTLQEVDRKKAEKGEPVILSYRIRKKSGDYVWFESVSRLIKDDNGGTLGFVTSSRDVTERKQAELEFETIIKKSVEGFWLADMQGRFLEVNEAYCRLVGYRRDELLKMSISDIETVEEPTETVERIARIKKVGGDRFETRHRCKNGKIVDVEISAN
ncbi:MAG: PAS domain S-box protein, partial [Dehalococcoidales bacterium]|nr:PAS domain S-box protein [Dehalococcoidales bacterium]